MKNTKNNEPRISPTAIKNSSELSSLSLSKIPGLSDSSPLISMSRTFSNGHFFPNQSNSARSYEPIFEMIPSRNENVAVEDEVDENSLHSQTLKPRINLSFLTTNMLDLKYDSPTINFPKEWK